jgi:copper chaperone CopZ
VDTLVVQIDGMTCSLCSRAVEDQLLKYDFVRKVIPKLNSQEMLVVVSMDSTFQFKYIAKAIQDAGFTVGKIKFKVCIIKHPMCYLDFEILNTLESTSQYFVIVSKGLVSKKIYKLYKNSMSSESKLYVIAE